MLKKYTGYKRLLALAALSGGAAPVERTATGNPLTFGTDLAKPLKSLIAKFLPVQASGTPAPDNILPITGWDAVNVNHAGKNLFNKNDPNCLQDTLIYGDGTTGSSQYGQAVTGYIPVIPGEKLMISNNINVNFYSCFYDASGNPVKYISGSNFAFPNTYFPVTVPNGAVNIRITFNKANFNVFQVEVGQTTSEYEPFVPIDTYSDSFPSTIYGGHVDLVTGVLTVDFAVISKKWGDFEYSGTAYGYDEKRVQLTENVLHAENGGGNSGNHYCDVMIYAYATASAETSHYYISPQKVLVAYLPEGTDTDTDIFILAKLTTPQEIQLTPQQINAIKGNNTVWSDANDSCEVTYLVSAAYADSHPVGGLGSGLLGFGSGNPDPDEPGEPDQPVEPAEPDQPEEQ